MNFVALDSETATHERNSACELGICVLENSEIVETKVADDVKEAVEDETESSTTRLSDNIFLEDNLNIDD